jgi:hypothetical protein
MRTRRRRHKAGNLADLRRVLWDTIIAVEALLDTRPPSSDLVLRSANSLSQLAGAYTRLMDSIELEARIATLEEAARHDQARPH